jgi:hypothetical protein
MKAFGKVDSELTYEKLKTYEGFENVSEAESEKIIEGIKRMAKILYLLYENEQQNKMNENEN